MIHFLTPWALAGLALVPAAWYVGMRSRRLAPRRRRASVVLRAVVLTAVVVALARPRLVRNVDRTATAFLVDLSASVPAQERGRSEEFIKAALGKAGPRDVAAVVAFGEEALVDRSARQGPLEPIRSVPGTGRTDIGAALRLGLAILPSDAGRRLVLLSDGRDNTGDLDRHTDLLSASRVAVDLMPLAAASAANETLVKRLEAPTSSRVGQSFDLTAVIHAEVAGPAGVTISDGTKTIYDEEVALAPGDTQIRVPVTVEAEGFRRYRVRVYPEADSRRQNNVGEAFTIVSGAPKILVVSPDDDEAGPLLAALEGADRKVEVVLPGEMPATLVGLAEYEAVILVNVRARDLPAGAMDALPAYVRDLGRGLAMVGGDHSFGAGGYRHTPVEKALPVDMEVRDREARPDIALAFVIDKSGSMAGCTTCGSGGGMGFGSGGALGKVDLAKEAVVEAADLLSDRDAAALVAFDGDSHTMWALQRHNDPDGFASAVAGITADGGTNIYSGLEAGVAELEGAAPPLKHIILLTDGWSDATGYDRVLERMADAHITLSVVAVGEDSAPYLEDLAAAGNGRFYPVVDPADVPQIFVEETITTLGMFVIEERFQPAPASPSEILRGLAADTLPPLGGYNGTTPKQSARVALVSHRDDPVLAQWQYGLGRAVAWTSDLKRQWATDWVPWSDFPSFAVQLVDWTVPAPDAKGLTTGVQAEGGKALITLQAADEGGRTLNALDVEAVMAADDERRTTVPLEQSAPGEYSGVAELPAEGAYLVRIVARSGGNIVGTQTAGFVVPYSPEFATVASEPTDPRAYRLAELTGGRIITDPAAAFAPVEGIRQARDVWPWLLLVAVVLLPVDVGVRRLKFKRADFAAARAWLAAIPGRLHGRGEALPEPMLTPLSAARERAQRRARRWEDAVQGAAAAPDPAPAPEPASASARGTRQDRQAPAPGGSSLGAEEQPDTFARLRKAKKRARKG